MLLRVLRRAVIVHVAAWTAESGGWYHARMVERLNRLGKYTATARGEPIIPATRRLCLLGIGVDGIARDAAMAQINAAIHARNPAHVITANPEYLMRARRDDTLRTIIERAALVVADGAGLIAAARLLDPQQRLSRVTGNDLVAALAAEGIPLFLLGAGPGVAEEAAVALKRQYPQAMVAGLWAGDAGEGGDEEARQRINATDARVVLVAYGMPKQDYWIARNLPHLTPPVAIGVGGALDFLAGRVPRAPGWMQARGLEWLYRLIRQPWRWRRILTVWQFAALVLIEWVWRRGSRREGVG